MQQVNERSCYFNDTFVFAANGSFSNVQELILGLRNGKVLMLTHVGQPVAPMTGPVATYHDAVAKLYH
jgi:hypothetical protein